MSLSCAVCEIFDIGRNRRLNLTNPSLFGAPLIIGFTKLDSLVGVVCLILPLAILVQCRRVTDSQTDGQTDEQTDGRTHDDSIYRASMASRGKNGSCDYDHSPFRVICHP